MVAALTISAEQASITDDYSPHGVTGLSHAFPCPKVWWL
jgi:hypothetical protein